MLFDQPLQQHLLSQAFSSLRHTVLTQQTSPSHILSVLVPDKQGIIFSIIDTLKLTGVLHHEVSQTVVHGTFTIALVVTVPADGSVDDLHKRLSEALGETAQISIVDYVKPVPATADRYVLTALGKADNGTVRILSEVVFQRGGNFTDFSSRVVDGQVQLVAEVDLPADVDLGQLQADLRHACVDESLQVRLQHQKLFTATNEVTFRRKFHAQ